MARKPNWVHITVFGANSPERKHPQRDIYIEATADVALKVFEERYDWPVGGWMSEFHSLEAASAFHRKLLGGNVTAVTLDQYLRSPYVYVLPAAELVDG